MDADIPYDCRTRRVSLASSSSSMYRGVRLRIRAGAGMVIYGERYLLVHNVRAVVGVVGGVVYVDIVDTTAGVATGEISLDIIIILSDIIIVEVSLVVVAISAALFR